MIEIFKLQNQPEIFEDLADKKMDNEQFRDVVQILRFFPKALEV